MTRISLLATLACVCASAQLKIAIGRITFTTTLDSPPATYDFNIAADPGVSYAFDHVEPLRNNPPNYLVLFPKSGTGPGSGLGFVGLNPEVIRGMQPGVYSLVAVYKTTDPVNPVSAFLEVVLVLNPNKKFPEIQSIVSSTSMQGNFSPGALVSILGTNFGSGGDQKFDGFGFYPTVATGTAVTFNGIPAPLLRVTPKRIDAIVPYEVASQSSADVVVSTFRSDGGYYYSPSVTSTVPVTDTAPAIFTADGSGSGQGLIYNGPDRLNNPDNPSAPGTGISFQISGVGQYISTIQGLGPLTPDGLQQSGQIVPYNGFYLYYINDPLNPVKLTIPLTVTIGGVEAYVFSLRPILYQPWDLLQVDARIPASVASGQQPIVVKIGNNDNSAQNVTISIQ